MTVYVSSLLVGLLIGVFCGTGVSFIWMFYVFHREDKFRRQAEDDKNGPGKDNPLEEFCRKTGLAPADVETDRGLMGEYNLFRNIRHFEELGIEILCDLYIPNTYKKGDREVTRTVQIDALLVMKQGIVLLECKNLSGTIAGNDDMESWTQTVYNEMTKAEKNFTLYSPIKQSSLHKRAVRKLLDDQSVPVFTGVVFGDECDIIGVDSKHVYSVRQIDSMIYGLMRSKPVLLDREQIADIASKLSVYTKVSPEIKQKHRQHVQSVAARSEEPRC